MTQHGIESQSPGPLADTLPTKPMRDYIIIWSICHHLFVILVGNSQNPTTVYKLFILGIF